MNMSKMCVHFYDFEWRLASNAWSYTFLCESSKLQWKVEIFLQLESVVHEAAVAAHVAFFLGAVDKFLLTHGDELICFDRPLALKSAGRAERPATTALTLVLDRGDGLETLGIFGTTPVHRLGEVGARIIERTWWMKFKLMRPFNQNY